MDFHKIEKKWQGKWEKAGIFQADADKGQQKFFVTFPYPYVNGAPHIGGAFTAFRVDSYARYKRMKGFNVLYPQGFHATGEPILGSIERLKEGDAVQRETFKLFGASDKDLKAFMKNGAEFTARYWMGKWVEALKATGFSIDWRRTFITAITPAYSRFIEWQYKKLLEKGYVTRGTHPVVWCPHCQSPTGDHDRLKGEGESPIEYFLVKFRLGDKIVPCGTLRPETVYGVTNLWVNPDVKYVVANVGGEKWIISEASAQKLKDQMKRIEVVGKLKASEIVGKYVENPVLKNNVQILPADFVDARTSTGVVMSVPSHAPYDWDAIRLLKNDAKTLEKYGIAKDDVEKIKPVSVIKVEGFGEHPAIEICEKINPGDREKIDEATAIIYKKEFHTGILKRNCGKYSGMKVSDVKERLSSDLIGENFADMLLELTGEVVCRCGTPNHVKILENQWFLKYSDPEWKEKVKACINNMKFYPEDARTAFVNTVDWLKDKACARKTGLGTRLPWDNEWIVETLSDSTIYMAYYTISQIINEEKLGAEKLTDSVFDYVFLGKGDAKNIGKASKLGANVIERMRNEFEYFYPVDLRNSGKDLVNNHLTFYLFHHTAIWDDQKYWPKTISVNGYVKVHGTKMSKSKGNVIPLMDLVNAVGADMVRINMVASSEGLNDADWSDESLKGYLSRIESLCDVAKTLGKAKRKTEESIDMFLKGRLKRHIIAAEQNFEELRFRSGAQAALFDATSDLEWYIERSGGIGNCSKDALRFAMETILKMVSPLVPHIAEELWETLGNKPFISVCAWPEPDNNKYDKYEEMENSIKNLLSDLRRIIKIAGDKKNAYVYVAAPQEFEHFSKAKEFINSRFGFEKLEICRASDKEKYDPQNKAAKAKFGKPGIYLE
ncbi:MAG: leucine--tRNA ligase [Candidatus Aenigmatarchaeota archaeon]